MRPRSRRQVRGRKSYVERDPGLVAQAKRLHRRSPKGHRRSRREVARELAAMGYVNKKGQPYSASCVRSMLGRVPSVDALPLFNGLTSCSPRRRPWSFRPPLSRLRRSRSLRENKHRASGPATWANAVTAAGVAVDRLTVPISVHLLEPITVHLLDPISVHCLEGHLLTRRLQNAGRQGHQDADADDCADGCAANLGGVDHNRRPRE